MNPLWKAGKYQIAWMPLLLNKESVSEGGRFCCAGNAAQNTKVLLQLLDPTAGRTRRFPVGIRNAALGCAPTTPPGIARFSSFCLPREGGFAPGSPGMFPARLATGAGSSPAQWEVSLPVAALALDAL